MSKIRHFFIFLIDAKKVCICILHLEISYTFTRTHRADWIASSNVLMRIYMLFCVCVCCFHLSISPEHGNEFTRMSQRGCILPGWRWLQRRSQWKPVRLVKTNWIQVELKNLRLQHTCTSLSWSWKVNGRSTEGPSRFFFNQVGPSSIKSLSRDTR